MTSLQTENVEEVVEDALHHSGPGFKTSFDLFQIKLYFARPSFSVRLFTLSSWPNKNSSKKVCEKYSNGYLPRNTGSLDNVSEQL